MNGKRVLITGANGLVGNYMIAKCINRGALVTAVDIVEPTNQIKQYKENYWYKDNYNWEVPKTHRYCIQVYYDGSIC